MQEEEKDRRQINFLIYVSTIQILDSLEIIESNSFGAKQLSSLNLHGSCTVGKPSIWTKLLCAPTALLRSSHVLRAWVLGEWPAAKSTCPVD